ncbi:hypothetical protein MXB_4767, partial [Myxobolus squamalis]
LVVPATVNDETLQTFKEFRSKNRAPVLSWVHPTNQCSITRCSQPMTAAIKRNKDDESYIQSIRDASPSCHNFIIFDARPISLKKLRDLCVTNYNSIDWFSLLDSTKWLDHVGKILSGAVKIAENVDRNRTSVVVHCSDGWDRTPQLTSLAMICLDPFYRTVIGFEVFSFINTQTLIEKEFGKFLTSGWYGSFMYDSVCLREKNPDLILNPFYCKARFPKVILPVPTIPYLKLWKSCYFKNNPLTKPKMDYAAIYSLAMEKKTIVTL